MRHVLTKNDAESNNLGRHNYFTLRSDIGVLFRVKYKTCVLLFGLMARRILVPEMLNNNEYRTVVHVKKIIYFDNRQPANILVDPGLNVRIADFGSSEQIFWGEPLFAARFTRAYAAPEVHAGEYSNKYFHAYYFN